MNQSESQRLRGCFCFFAQEEKKKGDGRNVDFPLPSLTYDDKTSL
jgi:hypothetical protein